MPQSERCVVDALPPEAATVIRLRFYEELSLKEISAITGAPHEHGQDPAVYGAEETACIVGRSVRRP